MITLLVGGARSGKSEIAERIAAALPPPVTYVATADPGGDPDFLARIEEHRRRRPADWVTIEAAADLPGALAGVVGTALVDSLGTWVASASDFSADHRALCRVLAERDGSTVVVTEEVGLGVHPSTEVGGRFRDALGVVNRAVAAASDEVFLVVAGRVLRLAEPPVAEVLPRSRAFPTPAKGAPE